MLRTMPRASLAGKTMEPLLYQDDFRVGSIQSPLEQVQRRLTSLGEEDSAFLHAEFLHHVIQSLLALPTDLYRPSVALLTAHAIRGEVPALVINFAAAVQIVHAAALSHQLPAMPVPANTDEREAQRDHIAVLAGDYLYAQAAYITAGLRHLTVMAQLAEAIKTLCTADVILQQGYMRQPYGIGLFRLSAAGAALLVNAHTSVVAAFAEYGSALDAAYQARTGSESVFLLRARDALADVMDPPLLEELLGIIAPVLHSWQISHAPDIEPA